MNRHDDFWSRAMRSAYLTSIEQAALLPLQVQWAQLGQDDNWHAAVGELRADGAAVVKPLTLARLDAWAAATWQGHLSPNFSMPPEMSA